MRYSVKERGAVGAAVVLALVAITAIWVGSAEVAVTSLALVGVLVVLLLLDGRRHERDHFRRLAASMLDKAREDRMRFEELGAGFRRSAGRVRELDGHLRHELGRQQASLTKSGDSTRALLRSHEHAMRRRLSELEVGLVREVGAMLDLHERRPGSEVPLPEPGGWALDASALVWVLHLVASRRPALVVECGSGASTVWIGYAVRAAGGRVVALEHDEAHAEGTRDLLVDHGLTDVAEVRHAPLKDVEVNGAVRHWYDLSAVEDLTEIGLLLVDGPPGDLGEQVRYPALPLLHDRLAPGAVIALDDIAREDEERVLRRWLDEEADLRRSTLGTERLAVLTRVSAPNGTERGGELTGLAP